MGLISDILEANRERDYLGYFDPCAIVWAYQGSSYNFQRCRDNLKQYELETIDNEKKAEIKKELTKNSAELEKLKANYLISEKSILEIVNRNKMKSIYMKDMLNELQQQLQSAYKAVCKLRLEIDKQIGLKIIYDVIFDDEEIVRKELLENLIRTVLLHMERSIFTSTSEVRRVVSDCAEIIRCLRKEEYIQSDKKVLNYYLCENMGLKQGHHVCKNCGMQLLNDIPYCLNCYERN